MLTFIIEIEVSAEIMRNLGARNKDMENCPKYNYFLKRKKSASEGGGHWDFRFCGFAYFLDRFFGFYSRKRRFLGLGVHYGLRIFHFLASGFRFSRKIFDIRCGFRFFLFDLFRFQFLSDLSGNYAPPLISNSS